MHENMKQKRLTATQRLLDGLSILVCVATIVYTIIVYKDLPQQIPSHFDAAGNITGYQGKSMLIVLAFLMLCLITLPMSVLVRVRKLYKAMNTPWKIPKGQEARVAEIAKDFLCITNLMMSVMFAGIILSCIRGWNPGVFIWIPMLVLAGAMVVLLIKTKKACKEPQYKDPWET